MAAASAMKVFICYAREDEALRQGLEKHLRALRWQGLITVWQDRDISPGAEWDREIDTHLSEAQLILLLISPDFIDSDYCYGIEMKQALKKHEQGEATVIPVILRPVYWQGTPFGKLQALPQDATPVVDRSWRSVDEAFFNVAEGIRKVVEEQARKAEEERIRKANEEQARRAQKERGRKAKEEQARRVEEERRRQAEEAAQPRKAEEPSSEMTAQRPASTQPETSSARSEQLTPSNQLIPPLLAATSPTQTSQPLLSSTSTPSPASPPTEAALPSKSPAGAPGILIPVEPARPKRGLYRRTVVIGLAGLMVVGAAGGGLLWLTHTPEPYTQNNWRWCSKCYGLYFGGASSPGPCPAGEQHDDSGSGNYTLTQNDLSRGGQQNWFWCYRCNGLFYGGLSTFGQCPAGGQHSNAGSGNYVLQQGDSSGQQNWFWCYKCNGLFYGGLSMFGQCPAGGQHSNAGSRNYVLPVA